MLSSIHFYIEMIAIISLLDADKSSFCTNILYFLKTLLEDEVYTILNAFAGFWINDVHS
jgi:hypothetical protein